jgi:GDP-4-dehydro-6-deoxy-D-mannose reductase
VKALVTGAAGFVGSHLAEFLLRRGIEVVGLVRAEDETFRLAPILPNIQIERGDIRDRDRMIQILRDTRPDRIFHLAGVTSPAGTLSNPRLAYDVNFVGTLNLLEGVRHLSVDCRILFVSSSEVYGAVRGENLPLREGSPLHPSNPYAGSKAAGEVLACQFYRGFGVQVVLARPFNHTGPRQSKEFVCSSLARQVAEINLGIREAEVQVGNPAVVRDFTDVRDIVRGYDLLLEKGELGEVYQLCSGRPVSVETILSILAGFASKPIRVVVDPARAPLSANRAIWGIADKAERTVGWKPQYSLETTLRDLESYWKGVLSTAADAKPE